MSDQPKERCAEIIEHLALIIDGDEATLEQFADHIAECDDCRDLVHDAGLAAEIVGHAGADYQAPEDLEERVITALDERGEDGLRPTVATGDSDASGSDGSLKLKLKETVPTTPAAKSPKGENAPAPTTENTSAKESQGRGRVIPLVMAAAAVLLVAVGGVGWWMSVESEDANSGGSEAVASHGADAGPNQENETPRQPDAVARIIQIVRAASDGATGVTVRPAGAQAFASASVDAELNRGGALRTDDRTRVRVVLTDGTELVLNHNTELTFDEQTPRLVRLAAGGEVLAEVATVEGGPPATFVTPTGRVIVLGTKLLVSATEDVSTVRVTRGAVRVQGAQGEPAEVKAGEEAVLPRNGAAVVSQAVNLAGSVSWSEMGDNGDDIERSTSGVGELRAHRPGEREDRDRPLNLTSHKVRIRIVGNVARTEVEEVFRNDGTVDLEGIYRFPLPPDARIARLALDVDGQMEDGAFVERDLASKIWRGVIRRATPRRQRQRQEEFIWVPGPWRDPALLEWQQGGQFQLKIFPIKAHNERRIILAYDQTVRPHGKGRRYVYPLAHSADASTRVGLFQVDVRVAGTDPQAPVKAHNYQLLSAPDGGATRLTMNQANFLPAGDLIIDYQLAGGDREMRWWTYQGAAAAAPSVEARRGSKRGSAPEVVAAQHALAADTRPYVVFALRPELPLRTQSRPRDYVLVVDSSQSMVGERFARVTQLVTGLVAEMDRRDRFTIMACDATCHAKPDGPRAPSSEAARELQQWLSNLRPAGASDLVATLNEAARAASQTPADRDVRVIYLGDGVSTVGHRRAAAITAEVRALNQRQSNLSFTTVGIGGEADTVVLSAVARAGGGHYIRHVPGQRTSATALRVLETTYGVALRDARLELPAGVVEVAPAALPTLRAGEEIVIAARFSGEIRGDAVLRGTVGGQPYEDRYPLHLTPSTAAGNAFVPRLWAAANINELELRGSGADQHRIVALSRGYGVMSRHTSLLVLESEAMFRAFRVDRARPTVDWTGEDDMDSNESEGTASHAGPSVLESANRGVGALGQLGSGRGGGGADGAAAGPRRRSARRPASTPLAGAAPSAAAEAPQRSRDSIDLDDVMGRSRGRRNQNRQEESQRQIAPTPRIRPGGSWMRRVWSRVGSINASLTDSPRIRQAVFEAEAALTQDPNSRDRQRNLFRALSRAGDLERAEQVADQWLIRDQLDPEALIALSDAIGRLGRRDEALRLLTGIVDLEPDNATLQGRLADAFDRAGDSTRACSHRIAIAETQGASTDHIVAAVRCERALGRHLSVAQMLDGLTDASQRSRVERAASRPPRTRGVNGDLFVEATWSGPQDVDISLVNSRGQRISWMGGRSNVVGDAARTPGRERLGLRWTPVGTYVIEVSRTDPTDTTPISGSLSVRALRSRRTIPFVLTGPTARVGSVRVRRESRMVPTGF